MAIMLSSRGLDRVVVADIELRIILLGENQPKYCTVMDMIYLFVLIEPFPTFLSHFKCLIVYDHGRGEDVKI